MLASLLSLAFAWEPSDLSLAWQADAVDHPFHLDVGSFPADVGSDAELEDAFAAGVATWHDADADLALTYGGTVGGASTAADGRFTTRWGAGPADGFRLATATSWSSGGGHTIDCDIEVFGENLGAGVIAWTLDEGGPGVDLVEVITHEVGHCLGLDHSDDPAAAMYASARDLRGLTDDDALGAQALFGEACGDGDGDGYDACHDCDDANVAVHPGAWEACDGVDNDCDGRVDAAGTLEATLGGDTLTMARTSWGNAFDVREDTVLHEGAQHLELAAEARVVWSVLQADGPRGWVRLVSHTEVVPAGVGWVSSPPLDVPLQAGERYLFEVGVEGGAVFAYGFGTGGSGPLDGAGVVATDLVPEDAFDAVPDGSRSTLQRLVVADPAAPSVCPSGTGGGTTSGGSASTTPEPSEGSGSSGCDCGGSSLSGPAFFGGLPLLGLWGTRRRP